MYSTLNTFIYARINSIDRYTYTRLQGNRANVPNRSVAYYKMTLHGTNEKIKRVKYAGKRREGKYFQSYLVCYTVIMAVLSSMYVLLENVQGNMIMKCCTVV